MKISIDMQLAISFASENSAFRHRFTKGGQYKIPIRVDEHILVALILPQKAETHLFREARQDSLFEMGFKLCRIVGWSNLLRNESDLRSRGDFRSSIEEELLKAVWWS